MINRKQFIEQGHSKLQQEITYDWEKLKAQKPWVRHAVIEDKNLSDLFAGADRLPLTEYPTILVEIKPKQFTSWPWPDALYGDTARELTESYAPSIFADINDAIFKTCPESLSSATNAANLRSADAAKKILEYVDLLPYGILDEHAISYLRACSNLEQKTDFFGKKIPSRKGRAGQPELTPLLREIRLILKNSALRPNLHHQKDACKCFKLINNNLMKCLNPWVGHNQKLFNLPPTSLEDKALIKRLPPSRARNTPKMPIKKAH